MKKLLILALLGLASEANAGGFIQSFGGSAYTSDPVVSFIRVKNAESFAAPKGALMSIDTSVGSDGVLPMGVAVKQSTTAANNKATFCVAAESLASGAYGECQVYGYHPAVNVRGDVSNVLKGGLIAMSLSISGSADGNSTNPAIGIALEHSTTSNTVPAFLRLK